MVTVSAFRLSEKHAVASSATLNPSATKRIALLLMVTKIVSRGARCYAGQMGVYLTRTLWMATPVVLFGLYVTGYFCLGTKHATFDGVTGRPVVVRSFRSDWLALLYVPAAMVEDFSTGNGASSTPD